MKVKPLATTLFVFTTAVALLTGCVTAVDSGAPAAQAVAASVASPPELTMAESAALHAERARAQQDAAAAAVFTGADGVEISAVTTTLSPSLNDATTKTLLPSERYPLLFEGTVTGAPKDVVNVRLEKIDTTGLWALAKEARIPLDTAGNGAVRIFSSLQPNEDATFRIVSEATANSSRVVGQEKTFSVRQKAIVPTTTTWQTDLTKLGSNTGFTIGVKLTDAPVPYNVALEKLDAATGVWKHMTTKTKAVTDTEMSFWAPRETTGLKSTYRVRTIPPSGDYLGAATQNYNVAYKGTPGTITNAELNGVTKTAAGSYGIPMPGTVSPAVVRKVTLEKFNETTKAWQTVVSTKTSASGAFTFQLGVSDASVDKYRIVAPESGQYSQIVGPVTTFVRTTMPYYVSLYNAPATVMTWDAVSPTWWVGAPHGSTVSLQRLENTKWTTVQQKKTDSRYEVKFDLPSGTRESAPYSESYRVYVPKYQTGFYATVSTVYTINRENPNTYTGTAQTVYNHIKAHCPNVTVRVEALPSGIWGQAYLGRGYIVIHNAVTPAHLRTVALHECAHMRQWDLYGTNWNKFVKNAAATYQSEGNLGMERNADCIANNWATNSYWAYQGNCTGEKGTSALAMARGQHWWTP